MVDSDTQRDELVGRLFSAGLGMAEVLTVYLGDVLGLYRALERNGAMTPPQLPGNVQVAGKTAAFFM